MNAFVAVFATSNALEGAGAVLALSVNKDVVNVVFFLKCEDSSSSPVCTLR